MSKLSKRNTLFLEGGLALLVIFVSWLIGGAIGAICAGVLGFALLVAWWKGKDEGEEEFEGHHLFDGPIPWAEYKPPVIKRQIDWYTWSFPDLHYDAITGVWMEHKYDGKPKIKGCIVHVTNNLDDKQGKGMHARVKAQIRWTYHNGYSGPKFSPAVWIGEEFGQIELPVGVLKKLLIATRSFDGQYWNGHGNTRLEPIHHIQSHSDMLPFAGSMVISLIGSSDELIAEAKWSWEENEQHWPMIKPLL